MRFSVVVPIFNRKEQVRASVESIWAAVRSYGDAELILVDNGSTDGTWEMLQAEYAGRALVRQLPDVHIGALRNFGASLASGDVLSFIDSDCLVGPEYLQETCKVLESTSAAATGSMYALPPSAHWIEVTWQWLNHRRAEGYVTLICGGNFPIRKSAFDAIGGFNEGLVTGEDAELCHRLLAHGFRIYESHRVVAVHLRNMNSLRYFFEKQVWQSLGMFGTLRHSWFNKPLLMTLAQLLLTLAGVLNLFLTPAPPAARAALLLLCICLVPAAAVIYRWVQIRKAYRPLRSVLLYLVYFYARIFALLKIITRTTD